MSPFVVLAVAIGGAIGAASRFAASQAILSAAGASFPWATLGVYVLGSALMGEFVVAFDEFDASAALRGFILVGVLGGFTTFSTFSLEMYTLFNERGVSIAFLYAVMSVFCSVLGLAVGLFITRSVL